MNECIYIYIYIQNVIAQKIYDDLFLDLDHKYCNLKLNFCPNPNKMHLFFLSLKKLNA